MVGNRAWSEEATQGRVCTKWRPLNEESVYLIRDGERKRGSEGEREGERDKKEGHSLASDESERGGNILKGSRASKSERKAEWRRQRRKEELRKETMWISAFYENLTEAHGHTCWHIFNVHKVAVYALSAIVFFPSSCRSPSFFTSASDVSRSMACRFSPTNLSTAIQFQMLAT